MPRPMAPAPPPLQLQSPPRRGGHLSLPPRRHRRRRGGAREFDWRGTGILALFLATACASSPDTDPPQLDIFHIQPFLFHILLTVQMDEDGTVYCGALVNSGSGTHVPSTYEMTSGSGLDGHGSAGVSAHGYAQVVIAGLSPATVYDLYCYATDAALNGIDIASTLQAFVSTASGGDYTPPTLAYVEPHQMIDSTEVRIYIQLSEDGTAWCVALRDHGLGTDPPSSGDIVNNVGADAWATVSLESQWNYKSDVRLHGLDEDSVYDIYCFAVDMSGNGIDRTPAYVPDAQAINVTKRTVKTLGTLVPTRFELTTTGGMVSYLVEPASWNVRLPQKLTSGCRELRNLESLSAPLSLDSATLVNIAAWDTTNSSDLASGCYTLPAAPRGGGPFVAVLRRGKCAFQGKVLRATAAGYEGILVIDYSQDVPLYSGTLPSMTDVGGESKIETPGWLISYSGGEGVLSTMSANNPGLVKADIEDRLRKPKIGNRARDEFGLRFYITI